MFFYFTIAGYLSHSSFRSSLLYKSIFHALNFPRWGSLTPYMLLSSVMLTSNFHHNARWLFYDGHWFEYIPETLHKVEQALHADQELSWQFTDRVPWHCRVSSKVGHSEPPKLGSDTRHLVRRCDPCCPHWQYLNKLFCKAYISAILKGVLWRLKRLVHAGCTEVALILWKDLYFTPSGILQPTQFYQV